MEDDQEHQISSPSLRQKIKSSLFCFPKTPHDHHHHGETLSSKARLIRSSSLWTKSRAHDIPDLKDRCRNFISRIGSQRHARRHSADFKYDALSYALNFEEDDRLSDDLPLRNFSSRLAPSPQSKEMITHGL